jgi:ankyrin repeat protein
MFMKASLSRKKLGKIIVLLFFIIVLAMGSTQAKSSGEGLLDAVKNFDRNRIKELVSQPGALSSIAETDSMGNGPLHVIARIGHYKYPPAGIPKLLIDSGVDVNAKNHNGATALDISLLSGWQKVYIALPSFGFHVLNQCEPTFA